MFNNSSSPTVTNCSFNGNSAEIGAGMLNSGTSPTVTNCSFSGNTASINGGGMWSGTNSNPTVRNCLFSANSATEGGGMANYASSHPSVINCTFSGNSASGDGGGMFNGGTSPSSPILINCILWGNSPNEIITVSGSPVVTFSDVQGGFVGTGNIGTDPLFVDPDNGDCRLSPGSLCIDAGDNTAVQETLPTRGLSTLRGVRSLPAAAVLRAGLHESMPASWCRKKPDAPGKLGPVVRGATPRRNAADDVFGRESGQLRQAVMMKSFK